MFPRPQRARRADLQVAARRFATLHQPHLALSFVLIPGFPGPRLTVSASKKVARKAVDRSVLKRRGRAAASASITSLPATFLGIVRIKQPADQQVYEAELQTLVQQVAERVA